MAISFSTIFFDAGGVLFDTLVSRSRRIISILKAKSFEEDVVTRALTNANAYAEELLKTGPWIDTWEKEENHLNMYYGKIVSELGNGDDYALQSQLFHQTFYVNHCVLFEEVREMLDRLYGKYRLGVISNALPSLDWVFDKLDIRKYFEHITISSIVRIRKPEYGIYQHALEGLNVRAEECLFIDDKLKNVLAAEELGFKGMCLDREKGDLRNLLKIID